MFGELDDHYEVTLYDVGMIRGPSVTAPKVPEKSTHAEYFTNNVLVGKHVESEGQKFLNGAIIHLTGLEEWCDASGFRGGIGQRSNEIATEFVKLDFHASASAHYKVGDGKRLRFLSEYRGPYSFSDRKSFHISERNSIELLVSEPISLRQMIAEVTIWQTFIAYGLRQPSYIDELMLLEHSGGEDFTRLALIMPGRRADAVGEIPPAKHTLFNQTKLGAKTESVLRHWRDKYEIIEMAVLLLMSTLYQEDAYFHISLLNYLQSLEILHRETCALGRFPDRNTQKRTLAALRRAIPTDLEDELRTYICGQLGYIGGLTLLDRLNHLFAQYPESLGPLFRNPAKDMALLKDARNFLTHFGGQKKFDKDFLWSKEAYVLKEKARLFVEICILGQLGMSDEEIHTLMEECGFYRDWRFRNQLEALNEHIASQNGDHEV
jgi:hypothetical protein